MGKTESKLSSSHVKSESAFVLNPNFKTIPSCLQYFSLQCPDKEAVVFVSSEGGREVVTYKELFDKSKQVACNLVYLGVKREEIVAINVRPCPEWLYICFGSIMAGAWPLAISFTYKDGSDLIAMMAKLRTCSTLVIDPGYENENWNILSKLLDSYTENGDVNSSCMRSLRYLICYDPSKTVTGLKQLEDLLTEQIPNADLPDTHENDVAMLFQTSGSTGAPKAVAHTHASLLNFYRIEEVCSFGFKDDIYFCERPFAWLGGFPVSVFVGKTRITMSGFCSPPKDKTKFLIETIRQEHCEVVFGIPATFQEMVMRKDEIGDDWPVKTFVIGGQPISKHMVSSIGALCKHILIVYGGTEFVMTSALLLADEDLFIEYSCGPLVPGVELKVVGRDGDTLPVGSRGELYLKNGGMFCEYLNDKDKTSNAFTDDRWYKTDDMGRMLNDGSLIVEGRKSNMIVSGGMNVAPEILETLISRCPGVDSVVLVPVPDDVMYQIICACVKTMPESGVNEHVVRKFCEDAHGDKLGLFTVLPKHYLILESFPETITGKVSRKTLTTMALNTFSK